VHDVIQDEFHATSPEPESWAMYKEAEIGWEREGESAVDLIADLTRCEPDLAQSIADHLSSEHHDRRASEAGEEDPYGGEVRYSLRSPNDFELLERWREFEVEIRSRARFFNRRAVDILDSIFGDLHRLTSSAGQILRAAGGGSDLTHFRRARRALSDDELHRILMQPTRELGPPPPALAGGGRMNPRWVPMFYGALDADTCVAEIRAPVGSCVVIGIFEIVRPLLLLDIGALRHLIGHRTSFFDPATRSLSDKAAFLNRLVGIIAKPVMPNEEEYSYLPTQAVAEYLAERLEPRIDGLLFPSTQTEGTGQNVVLFPRSSIVAADLDEQLDVNVSTRIDEDDDLIFIKCGQRKAAPTATDRTSGSAAWITEVKDEWGFLDDAATLKHVLSDLEVHRVQAVTYRTTPRQIFRSSGRADETDF
jgi:RES domain-containing protein